MIPFVRAVDIETITLPNAAGVFKPGARAGEKLERACMTFATKHCAPLPSGTRALDEAQIRTLLPQIPGWKLGPAGADHPRRLERRFEYSDFRAAIGFLNRLAVIAEVEQHHPDLQVRYNKVDVALWTHSIEGVSENDFILAAKLDVVGVG
jgi:4a-hydroxytetrahydrobiopterin dehydratase